MNNFLTNQYYITLAVISKEPIEKLPADECGWATGAVMRGRATGQKQATSSTGCLRDTLQHHATMVHYWGIRELGGMVLKVWCFEI
jgi:hypothetical protein